MEQINGVYFGKLNDGKFNTDCLDGFIARQEVNYCWRKTGDDYKLQPVEYSDNWNSATRRKLAERLICGDKFNSVSVAAVKDGKIIGFAILSKELFGSEKQYIDLAEFYVSAPFRRQGIGFTLFSSACDEAKRLGAKKLYISAHSAKESIAAYKKYGCTFAQEINAALAEKEPCDLQLEYDLSFRIYEVEDKEKYIDLLLLADEQESMIEKYLDRGEMYVLDDNGVKAEIVVCDEGGGILEIKNLAVYPQFQCKGYGKKLIDFVCERYKNNFSTVRVGTGDSPLTVPFYEKCGFKRSHTVKNFFTDNYDHPIFENGKQLVDMIYFTKECK